VCSRDQCTYFGEKQNLTDLRFGIHHNFLHSGVTQRIGMETVAQGLSRELRGQKYTCVFCESVWQRLQEGNIHSDLESLYLEHLKKYHGMTA
jgi:hypothetical protein